jgi:hypothetical protein
MATPYDLDHRLMEIIVRSPGRSLDDLVAECPDLTWGQVFLTIDRLSREGALRLTRKGRGLYTVHLSDHARDEARHRPIWEPQRMIARRYAAATAEQQGTIVK